MALSEGQQGAVCHKHARLRRIRPVRYGKSPDRPHRGGQRHRRSGALVAAGVGRFPGGGHGGLFLARRAYLGHGGGAHFCGACPGGGAVRLPRVEHRRLGAACENGERQPIRPHRAPALRLAYAAPHGGYHSALHLRSRYAQKLYLPADDGDSARGDFAGAFRLLHDEHGCDPLPDRPRACSGHHPVFVHLLPHHRRGVSQMRRKRGRPIRHGAGEPCRRARGKGVRQGAARAGQIHRTEPLLYRPMDEACKAHGHVLERGRYPLRYADPADSLLRRGVLHPGADAGGGVHRLSRLLRADDLARPYAGTHDLRNEQGGSFHRPACLHHERPGGGGIRRGPFAGYDGRYRV